MCISELGLWLKDVDPRWNETRRVLKDIYFEVNNWNELVEDTATKYRQEKKSVKTTGVSRVELAKQLSKQLDWERFYRTRQAIEEVGM
jgi:hypothetical protein